MGMHACVKTFESKRKGSKGMEPGRTCAQANQCTFPEGGANPDLVTGDGGSRLDDVGYPVTLHYVGHVSVNSQGERT